MKKIINGKRYDTATAIEIGYATGGSESRSDFSHWSATLYKTPRSGAYFVAGEGGPMTRFGKSLPGGGATFGEDIIVMSRDEAMKWAEENLPTAVVEDAFSDVIEDA